MADQLPDPAAPTAGDPPASRAPRVRWWRRDPWWPERWWLRRNWLALSLLLVLVLGAGTVELWMGTCGFAGCPTAAEILAYRPSEGGRVLDREGDQIGQMRPIRRVNVALATVPEHVREAFLATEDRRFYEHHGVDLRGVVRAVVRNVTALGVREGFSTITMQVARNTFLADRFHYSERSLRKKLLELRVAALLERHLTKEQIFEHYLNAVYLGNGTYGVEAASRDLFGRSVEHLAPDEGAMLAALPKGPSAYTPRRHPQRARQRRDLVLGLMAREGYLTEAEAARLRRRPLELAKPDERAGRYRNSYALDAVRQTVDSLLRGRLAELPDLVVHTTVDDRAQRAAERAVQRQATAIQRRVGGRGEAVQGALVALDPATGGIVALVGGREHVREGFNRAFAAKRQPGSAFKPFVYAAALESGFTTASLVEDAPVTVRQGNRVWQPTNADGNYLGQVTLRRALARSSNTAAVRLTRAVGERRVVETARRNGIHSELAAVPSIALGALEVTPLELVSAYAPFANGGLRIEPHLVERIETIDGRVLYERRAPTPPVVMDERDAFLLTSMLRSVVDEGTATAVRRAGIDAPVAGKTGTTNDGADVWFVGYTPGLVAGVWFGFDTPRSLGRGAGGGSLAAPAWAQFYREGWASRERGAEWEAPDGIVRRMVDPSNGRLAGEWCEDRRAEWFKAGSEPTEESECSWYWADEPNEGGDGFLDELRSRLRGVFGLPERPAPPPPPPDRRGGDERWNDERWNDERWNDERRERRREEWRRERGGAEAAAVARLERQARALARRELGREARRLAQDQRDLRRVIARELREAGLDRQAAGRVARLLEDQPVIAQGLARVMQTLGAPDRLADPLAEQEALRERLTRARALTLSDDPLVANSVRH